MQEQIKRYLNKLEEVRIQKFLSKNEVAQQLDITVSTLLNIYRPGRRPALKTIRRIKYFLEVVGNYYE